MSYVHLVRTVAHEGFVAAAPYEAEVLLGSIVRDAAVEAVNYVEGAREAKVVINE
jgi:hypothetical protein